MSYKRNAVFPDNFLFLVFFISSFKIFKPLSIVSLNLFSSFFNVSIIKDSALFNSGKILPISLITTGANL